MLRQAERAPGAPAVDADLYSDAALEDSAELFARIREAGPVVWLPRNGMYAMGRFEDVRAALRDDELFLSGGGVAANPIANSLGKDTTLNSDGGTHTARRRVLMKSPGAKALAAVEEPIMREANSVVEALLERERFETAADFSSHLPVSVVSELVGLRAGSERMLRWAAATFDGLGPINRRSASPCRELSAYCCTACGCARAPSAKERGRPPCSRRRCAGRSPAVKRGPS
jgi:cytochrome P450